MKHPVNPFIALIFVMIVSVQSILSDVLNDDGDLFSNQLEQIKMESAKRAMDMGFPSLAITFYKALLEHPAANVQEKVIYRKKLLEAYLHQGNWEDARQQLFELQGDRSSEVSLFRALFQFRQKNIYMADRYLEQVNDETLPPKYLPWYYLLQGLVLDFDGQREKSSELFEKAKSLAMNADQLGRIEIAIVQSEFFHTEATESMAIDLQNQLKSFRGQSTEADFLRQYVIILHLLGRSGEALSKIEEYLSRNSDLPLKDRNSFLLLTSQIAEKDSPKSSIALRTILGGEPDPDSMNIAFTLLMQNLNSEKDYNEAETFFETLLEQNEQHPMAENLLFALIILEQKKSEYVDAEKYALELIEVFPGSAWITPTYNMLASIALSQNPPKFRTATRYLNQLLELEKDPRKRVQIRFWIAHCYFLDADYANAFTSYKNLVTATQDKELSGKALFQFTNTGIKIGDLTEVTDFLDQLDFGLVEGEYRWQSEWNLILALKEKKGIQEAVGRVRSLRSENIEDLPPELALRFMWFETQLTFRDSRDEQVISLANSILELRSQLDESLIPKSILDDIQAQTLLVKGRALFRLNEKEEALSVFEQLRKTYPDQDASAISMHIEASYFSSVGLSVESQARLVQLAGQYPKSPIAPRALLEAALNAEKRGIKNSYEEAINLLNNLLEKYPKSSYVFDARLKQGHLLRRLSQFGAALKVYENLIQDFKNDDRVIQAEISRIDCLNAMGNRNEKMYGDAIVYLENLIDNQETPKVLVELRFKLGLLYKQTNQLSKAEQVWWKNVEMLASNEQNNSGFWMSKSILELGDLLIKREAITEAEGLLRFILDYQMPGIAIAKSRLERLKSR